METIEFCQKIICTIDTNYQLIQCKIIINYLKEAIGRLRNGKFWFILKALEVDCSLVLNILYQRFAYFVSVVLKWRSWIWRSKRNWCIIKHECSLGYFLKDEATQARKWKYAREKVLKCNDFVLMWYIVFFMNIKHILLFFCSSYIF